MEQKKAKRKIQNVELAKESIDSDETEYEGTLIEGAEPDDEEEKESDDW